MDRTLDAIANFDTSADVVRIDIRGSLHLRSRHELTHVIRRVRWTGLRCHICIDLSHAALVESSALAGLRSDLNALDAALQGGCGAGVSLQLTSDAHSSSMNTDLIELPLPRDDDIRELFPGGRFAGESPDLPVMWIEALYGRPLTEFSNEELRTASDDLFALLDCPYLQNSSDLLGRYNDIGLEISRRPHDFPDPGNAEKGHAPS
ncbi:hypothetical protein AB0280_01090 [Pseudarthrobacter sp902506025]|uniref:Xylose isomerase-like TIM barrel domain-containing protein n=1 Tax=Pseudarthrobacter defluvii TaxID=410837 RepID=A0ABT9UFD3_9MICC|nr:hypothetical protein [Pseudarthrobacter defluvii]MDQ0118354.1 hypothetical protein [Pseudarthrobacter defluvii]